MSNLPSLKTILAEDGAIIHDLPFADYLALPAVSRSQLFAALTKSPAHCLEEKPRTKATDTGTIAHQMLQQPDLPVIVRPADAGKGSNAAKAALVDWICATTGAPCPPHPGGKVADGKVLDAWLEVLEPIIDAWDGGLIASVEQYDVACRIRDEIRAHPLAGAIYDSGSPEVTMVARDPESGVLVKIRLDWLPAGHTVLVDLKTAAEVWEDAVERSAGKWGYHFQAAVYRHVYHLVTGDWAPWLNVYAETKAPWSVMVVPMPDEAIERGMNAARHALSIWAMCEQHQIWPGPGWDWGTMQYELVSIGVKPWAI